MALAHPFLLHGILAVSALHLAHAIPARRQDLTALAVLEEHQALPAFREALTKTDPDTVYAMFAFSGGSLIPYILASSSASRIDQGRLPSREDNHPHWFLVSRGMNPLLVKHFEVLKEGPFGSELIETSGPVDPSFNPDDSHLAELELMIEQSRKLKSAEYLEACIKALECLRHASCVEYSPCKTVPDTYVALHIWPVGISQEFVEFILDRRPEALVILAHYCVLLKKANDVWFFKGLGTSMLNAIEHELSEKWKPWIQWALDYPEAHGRIPERS